MQEKRTGGILILGQLLKVPSPDPRFRTHVFVRLLHARLRAEEKRKFSPEGGFCFFFVSVFSLGTVTCLF